MNETDFAGRKKEIGKWRWESGTVWFHLMGGNEGLSGVEWWTSWWQLFPSQKAADLHGISMCQCGLAKATLLSRGRDTVSIDWMLSQTSPFSSFSVVLSWLLLLCSCYCYYDSHIVMMHSVSVGNCWPKELNWIIHPCLYVVVIW